MQITEKIISLFRGQMSSAEYLRRNLGLMACALLALSSSVFSGFYFDSPVLLWLLTALMSLGLIGGFFFCLSWDVRRARTVLSDRPAREIYVLVGLSLLLSFLFPFFGLLKIAVLFFAEDGADKTDFYQGNIEAKLERLTAVVCGYPRISR